MDPKEIRNSVSLGVSDDSTKYVHSSPTLPANKNKPYHDIGSSSMAKVDATNARPCAIIGPDRVLPPAPSDIYLRKTPVEPWLSSDNVFHQVSDYPNKISDYQPSRNISPRQTFQENMQRILVPPTYSSIKNSEESSLKNPKLSMPQEAKYCDVPYNTNSVTNDPKSVRNSDIHLPNIDPAFSYGWTSGVNIRPPRPYGAPDFYQYPDYSSCAGPRQMIMNRTHRTHHQETTQAYPERLYQEANIRFKPYPTLKEKHQKTRYEYINNYPNTFHPPVTFPPHKYDLQKPLQTHPYPVYPQLKYLDRRFPFVDTNYQRPKQTNLNGPYRNQAVPPPYGPIPGSCLQNKSYNDISSKPMTVNKLHYDSNNKIYLDLDPARNKGYPVLETGYYNDMNHARGVTLPPNHSATNMHSIPQHPIYRSTHLKPYEYNLHYRNLDPSVSLNYSLPRLPLQFSPNAIAISPSDSNTSNDTTQTVGTSQEDCGYVSQSSTASVRSLDSGNIPVPNDFYRRREYTNFGIIRNSIPMNDHNSQINKNRRSSSSKKNINVREFLQMWNEGEDETIESNKEVVSQNHPSNLSVPSKTISNQEHLYVLGSVNVPTEELSKYEHIQKFSKLPENIIGYNNNELLNQYEKLVESTNTHNILTPKLTLPKDNSFLSKKFDKENIVLPRPVSPLDVEAKISQSVIHKEVGCNFEIKPCSPKMLNVEVATPVQNVLGERIIEKLANPIISKAPILSRSSDNKTILNSINNMGKITNCNLINTQYSPNNYPSLTKLNNNYNVQDFNTNSGISLASLPRLDNDIELNFPEINQQFVNANKIESDRISPAKDFSQLNVNQISQSQENIEQSDLSSSQTAPVNNVEKEFLKLSKYRKNKKYDSISKENNSNDKIPIQLRVDSVIIKNPENIKLAEDITEAGFSVPDIVEENLNYNTESRLDPDKYNLPPRFENNEIYDFSFETAIDFSLNKNEANNHFNTKQVDTNNSYDIHTSNTKQSRYYDNTDNKACIIENEIKENKQNETQKDNNLNESSEYLSIRVNEEIVISNSSDLPDSELHGENNVPVIKELASEMEETRIEDLDFKKENDTSVIRMKEILSLDISVKEEATQNKNKQNEVPVATVINTNNIIESKNPLINNGEIIKTDSENVTEIDKVVNKHDEKKEKQKSCNSYNNIDETNYESVKNIHKSEEKVIENCNKTLVCNNICENNTHLINMNVVEISKQPEANNCENKRIDVTISNIPTEISSVEKEYNIKPNIKRSGISDIDRINCILNDEHEDIVEPEPHALFNINDCNVSATLYQEIDKSSNILTDKHGNISDSESLPLYDNNDSKVNVNQNEINNSLCNALNFKDEDISNSKLEIPAVFNNNNCEVSKKLYNQIDKSSITLKDKCMDMLESDPPSMLNNNSCREIDNPYEAIVKSSISLNDIHSNMSESKFPVLFNKNDREVKEKKYEEIYQPPITLNAKHDDMSELELPALNDCKSKEDEHGNILKSQTSILFKNNSCNDIKEPYKKIDKSFTALNDEHEDIMEPLHPTAFNNNDCKGNEKSYEEADNLITKLTENHIEFSESEPSAIFETYNWKVPSKEIVIPSDLNDKQVDISELQYPALNECDSREKQNDEIDRSSIALNDKHGNSLETEPPVLFKNNNCECSEEPYEKTDISSTIINHKLRNISEPLPFNASNNNDCTINEKPYEEADKLTLKSLTDKHREFSESEHSPVFNTDSCKDSQVLSKKIDDTSCLNYKLGDILEPEPPILFKNNNCKCSEEPYEKINISPTIINHKRSNISEPLPSTAFNNNDCKSNEKPYEEVDKLTLKSLTDKHKEFSESELSPVINTDSCKDSQVLSKKIDDSSTLNDKHGDILKSEFPVYNIHDFQGSEKLYGEINKSSTAITNKHEDILELESPASLIINNSYTNTEIPYQFMKNHVNINISETQDKLSPDARNSKSDMCTEVIVRNINKSNYHTTLGNVKISEETSVTSKNSSRTFIKEDSNGLLDRHHIRKDCENKNKTSTQSHDTEYQLQLNPNNVTTTNTRNISQFSTRYPYNSTNKQIHICKELFSPWIQKLFIYNEGSCKIFNDKDRLLEAEVKNKNAQKRSSERHEKICVTDNLYDDDPINGLLCSTDTVDKFEINVCDSSTTKGNNECNLHLHGLDLNLNEGCKEKNNKPENFAILPVDDKPTFNRRKILKRSLSESALQDFNENEDLKSLTNSKRRKGNEDIVQSHIISEDICSIIQSNRRNSIATFYNDDNLYIVIDNDLILTEENEESEKIYYTEMSEESNITQNESVVDVIDNATRTEINGDGAFELCEYSATLFTHSLEKAVEDSWVEDVACVETVVSEDVIEDFEYDLESPSENNFSKDTITEESLTYSDSEHIDKVKNIYGTTLCNDNTHLLETLYRTPQMDVNKTLVDIESHNTDEDIHLSEHDSCNHKLDTGVPLRKSYDILDEKENIEQCSEHNDVQNTQDTYQNIKDSNDSQSYGREENEETRSLDSNNDDFIINSNKNNSNYSCSSSPEVSSTTSEERNSSILLKITNYNGSRVSQINEINNTTINRISYKLTEKEEYRNYNANFSSQRPLITKAAQKYIPPLKESIRDLKVKLPLPRHRLDTLQQLKRSKAEPKIDDILKFNDKNPKQTLPKKHKPKFEDVLKSIDEIHFKKHKDKVKRVKSEIPRVIIKKSENGAHYASSKTLNNNESYNPDLTGRKWQPWVFLEKNNFIDRMAIKNKVTAVYCHRKNDYVLADRFKKYKSIYNANFVISRPKYENSTKGNLKYTIRLKHI